MKTLLFLARRFLFNVRQRSIRIMLIVAFISITLGSGSLALVSAIMKGFQVETTRIVQGIQPDLIISSDRALNLKGITQVIEKEFSDCISAVAPIYRSQAMVKNNDTPDNGAFILLYGINPPAEMKMEGIKRMIISPTNTSLDELLKPNSYLIGEPLARALGVTVGSSIALHFASEGDDEDTIEKSSGTIAGIFKTGVSDTDTRLLITSDTTFKELYPQAGVEEIGLKLTNPATHETLKETLSKRFDMLVESWQDRYPALLAALTLERYSMLLILILITLVAAMNIISLLFMFITYKNAEIAILKTIGFTAQELVRLFILMGVSLSIAATTLGILIAGILSTLLQDYHLIQLPKAYFVSHVPAHFDLPIIIMVYTITLTISLLASYIPAKTITKIKPADLLKKTA